MDNVELVRVQQEVTAPKQVLFEPFPKQMEFLRAALSCKFSFVLYGGAIRGGKTFTLLGLFLMLCRIFPGSRWAIVRKDRPTIERNLIPAWDKIKPTNFIPKDGWNDKNMTTTFMNGSQLIFFPESYDTDKELNRWRGLEVNGFGYEELNECQQVSFEKGFERAGSYVIPATSDNPEPNQPFPLVAGTCNPTWGWVKKLIYTPWKEKELKPEWHYIQAKITDNIPLLKAQPHYLPSLKANLNKFQYMVFVEGNWDVQLKTGGEFLRSFEINDHVKAGIEFDPDELVNISWDANSLPYIAVTFWQVRKRMDGTGEIYVITQVGELPCREPYNSPRPAATQIARFLKAKGYKPRRVRIFGDRSTKNRNAIDEFRRSFFQIMVETLLNEGFSVEDMMMNFAPIVSNMADFVNDIFAREPTIPGFAIEIAEECTDSIGDYIITKQDMLGNILKIRKADVPGGPSYEHNGHLTDTLKDFIVGLLLPQFTAYCNRNQALQAHGISTVTRQSKITP